MVRAWPVRGIQRIRVRHGAHLYGKRTKKNGRGQMGGITITVWS
jgi:hypothetical protein